MKKGIALGIVFLFVVMNFTSISGNQIDKNIIIPSVRGNTLYVGGSGPGNYTKIQDAIDNASDGDTVFVYNEGSPYYERLVIDMSINLIGEDRDNTVIDGSGNGDVINVTADWVNISRFTIRHGYYLGYDGYDGIEINSNNNSIRENNILYVLVGIEINLNYNIITDNNISYSRYGIFLFSSSRNTIKNNNLSYNE